VTVRDYPEYDQSEIIVPPDGRVAVPGIGAVQVSGKTREQVQAALRGLLGRQMRNPQLTVTLVNLRPVGTGLRVNRRFGGHRWNG
jgi:protein involved in polysaccharide export with SLBB domain